MFNFNDQIVIVTGGTRGIGSSISKAFINAGATVVATYSGNDEAANAFKDSLGENSTRLHLRKFNVSKFNEVEKFFENFEKDFGQLHVLVNNAGIRKDQIIAAMEESEWDQVVDTNLKGTFNMTHFAVKLMAQKRYGRIINMSSIGGKLGLSGQANYAASKAGQIALSLSVSKEVAKRNITINNVCPGFIETDLIRDLPEEQIKEYKSQVPMKRFGKPEEVAHAVMFFASREASYITGAALDIAGGL
ncbi:MAG TPA: SDR family NAD(P)-dependent oxidoreductase [Bacteriovoracaceae bacterium]|nr:SDR family NAD(P)-dependent oxidoreductase [Bacteriovoracaceae bacterium]